MKSFLYLRREQNIDLQTDSGQGDSLCYFSSFPNPSPFLFLVHILGYSQSIAGWKEKSHGKLEDLFLFIFHHCNNDCLSKNQGKNWKEPEAEAVWRVGPRWLLKSLCWKMTADVHKKQKEDDLVPSQSAFSHATGKSNYKYRFKEYNLSVLKLVFWVQSLSQMSDLLSCLSYICHFICTIVCYTNLKTQTLFNRTNTLNVLHFFVLLSI